jgi:hypothetical protein
MMRHYFYLAWLLPQTQLAATGGAPGDSANASSHCSTVTNGVTLRSVSYLDALKQQLPAEPQQLLPNIVSHNAESPEEAAFWTAMVTLNEQLRAARQQLQSRSSSSAQADQSQQQQQQPGVPESYTQPYDAGCRTSAAAWFVMCFNACQRRAAR